MRALRHEGYAVGDLVRAWDFKPAEDRRDRFVDGRIVEVLDVDGMLARGFEPYRAYRIQVYRDSAFPETPRPEIFAPLEVTFLEWPERIQYLAEVGMAWETRGFDTEYSPRFEALTGLDRAIPAHDFLNAGFGLRSVPLAMMRGDCHDDTLMRIYTLDRLRGLSPVQRERDAQRWLAVTS